MKFAQEGKGHFKQKSMSPVSLKERLSQPMDYESLNGVCQVFYDKDATLGFLKKDFVVFRTLVNLFCSSSAALSNSTKNREIKTKQSTEEKLGGFASTELSPHCPPSPQSHVWDWPASRLIAPRIEGLKDVCGGNRKWPGPSKLLSNTSRDLDWAGKVDEELW